MRAAAAELLDRYGDRAMATGSVGAFALGTVMALAGAGQQSVPMIVAGAAVGMVGLVLLLALELLDGLLVVVLAAPLPALVSNTDTRITLVSIITAGLVFAWLLGHALRRRPVVPLRFPLIIVALPVAAAVTSVFFATDVAVSSRELLNFVVLFAFLVVAAENLARTERTRILVGGLVVVGALVGALSVLEGVGLLPGAFRLDETYYRSALGFGQPNALGLFLATIVPFGVYARSVARDRGVRLAATGALACMALGLIATVSRGSWLAVVAGAGALIFAGQARWVLRAWGVILVLVIVVDVATGGLFRDTAERTVGDWVIEQRAALMLAGVSMFVAHPVIGVGVGGFAPNLERFGAQIPQLFDIKPTPHNAYVQMAAETGLIGFVTFALFLGVVLVRATGAARAAARDPEVDEEERGYRRAVAWSVATIAGAGMVTWPFAHGPGQVVMMVLAMALLLPDRGR